MKEFPTIQAFLEFLASRPPVIRKEQEVGMEKAADLVVKTAQDMIGEYQPAAGPFAAWQPLSELTLEGGHTASGHFFPGKIALGYAPPDNPLLRTGQLRGSIERTIAGNTLTVGSHDPVAKDQEFGTHSIPPRPFIGPAMFRQAHKASNIIFGHIMAAAFGGTPPRSKD